MVFEDKKRLQLSELREYAADPDYIRRCENAFRERVDRTAQAVVDSGVPLVMLTGPSASGKTTSARKLAQAMTEKGKKTSVVSLDNFYRNRDEYPRLRNGEPDFEHLHALNVELVNDCLEELVSTGVTWIPAFDFNTHSSVLRQQEVRVDRDTAVIIEGIHALNPELSRKVDHGSVMKIYAGLRTEYYEGRKRVIATRDLRITRRIIRDDRDRGHAPEATLALWKNIMAGEEKWIKPFKPDADMLLNTALDYEPCVFAQTLRRMADDGLGGKYQEDMESLAQRFGQTSVLDDALVPEDSLLREFLGGLKLMDTL